MVQSTEDTDYERTPLLNSTEVQENIISANEDATFGGGANQQKPSKSFNLAQVLLLCAIGLAEPLAMFCIFPFINSMIFNSGNVQESDVGFWSGLIESVSFHSPDMALFMKCCTGFLRHLSVMY